MNNNPKKIIERWIEYVNDLKIENVANLYNDKSTLMPTFSPHSISRPYEIKEYFRKLSTRPEMRVELHSETLKQIEIDEYRYILMGIYSFHFKVDDAKLSFPSRFTFLVDISKEKPILHHHSSQIPRTLS